MRAVGFGNALVSGKVECRTDSAWSDGAWVRNGSIAAATSFSLSLAGISDPQPTLVEIRQRRGGDDDLAAGIGEMMELLIRLSAI